MSSTSVAEVVPAVAPAVELCEKAFDEPSSSWHRPVDEPSSPCGDARCPICLVADPVDALVTGCGHSFCAGCLKQHLESSAAGLRGACPVCRVRLSPADVAAAGATPPEPLAPPAEHLDAAALSRGEVAAFRRAARRLHVHGCPGCGVPIEKSGGCSQVHCTACGLRFHWSRARGIGLCRQVHLRHEKGDFAKYWGDTCEDCSPIATAKLAAWRVAVVALVAAATPMVASYHLVRGAAMAAEPLTDRVGAAIDAARAARRRAKERGKQALLQKLRALGAEGRSRSQHATFRQLENVRITRELRLARNESHSHMRIAVVGKPGVLSARMLRGLAGKVLPEDEPEDAAELRGAEAALLRGAATSMDGGSRPGLMYDIKFDMLPVDAWPRTATVAGGEPASRHRLEWWRAAMTEAHGVIMVVSLLDCLETSGFIDFGGDTGSGLQDMLDFVGAFSEGWRQTDWGGGPFSTQLEPVVLLLHGRTALEEWLQANPQLLGALKSHAGLLAGGSVGARDATGVGGDGGGGGFETPPKDGPEATNVKRRPGARLASEFIECLVGLFRDRMTAIDTADPPPFLDRHVSMDEEDVQTFRGVAEDAIQRCLEAQLQVNLDIAAFI